MNIITYCSPPQVLPYFLEYSATVLGHFSQLSRTNFSIPMNGRDGGPWRFLSSFGLFAESSEIAVLSRTKIKMIPKHIGNICCGVKKDEVGVVLFDVSMLFMGSYRF